MLDIILIILVFILSACVLQCLKSKKYPPGPIGLPFIGYGPFLGQNEFKAYYELGKRYGPVFSVQLGMQMWVILSSRKAINEAFAKRGRSTSGRVESLILKELSNDLSVAFIDGPVWKTHRQFIIRIVKSFGTPTFEYHALTEVEQLCKAIEKQEGEAFECQTTLAKAVANVGCSLTMGRRFSYDDERLSRMVDALTESVSKEKKNAFGTLLIAPFLRHIPPFKYSYAETQASFKYLNKLIRQTVEEHKNASDNGRKRDYVDEYLDEMRKGDCDATFTEERLMYIIQDLLVASTDTTTNTLRFCILALVLYPHYQKQISQEISNVVGCGENVCLADQDNLPLTRAFLHEVMRCCPAVPLAIPHVTHKEITVCGNRIPPNTPIMANIWAAQRCGKYFDDPHEFRPERHLDGDGCYVPNEAVMPFSLGARRCVGEPLARVELFVFLSTLVQRFEITQVGDNQLESLDDGILAITYAPKEFFVQFRKR